MDALVNALFRFTLTWRNLIVKFFEIFYILQAILVFFEYRAIVLGQGSYDVFYEIGKKSGELAICAFILTTIPGMARRFGISHKLIAILMTFRRYIGIACFMFVLDHLSAVWIFPSLAAGGLLLPEGGFELFGLIAAILLFLLFITSNDVSTKYLGDWWGRIHSLTYITMWIITLHVMFQSRFSWALLIGATGVAELASFVVAWQRRQARRA